MVSVLKVLAFFARMTVNKLPGLVSTGTAWMLNAQEGHASRSKTLCFRSQK